MKKKFIALLVVTVLFVSCSNEKSVPASALPKQKVTVSWWGAEARNAATVAAFDEYKKINPNVEFEYIIKNYSEYLNAINVMYTTNDAPDIISLDAPWVATAITQNERYVDLIKYNDVIDLTGFDRYILRDYCESQGRLVMVPLGINASCVMIDKKAAHDFGINLNAKLTWEKLIEDGRKINTVSPDDYYITTNLDNLYQCIFKPYLSQMCGYPLMKDEYTPNFTKQQLEQAFDYVNKLYKNNALEPFVIANQYANIYDNPKWAQGKLHASLDWTSAMIASNEKTISENYMLATIPILPNAENTAIIVRPTGGFAINVYSKNIPLCAEIINFFVNDEKAVNKLGTVRSVPANINAQHILQTSKVISPSLIEILEVSVVKKGLPENPASQIDKIKNLCRTALQNIAVGTMSPKQAAESYYPLF